MNHNHQRRTIESLKRILSAIEQIKDFVVGITFDEFGRDRRTVFAVTHCLGEIGRASNRIRHQQSSIGPISQRDQE